jgi:hypothetical protein
MQQLKDVETQDFDEDRWCDVQITAKGIHYVSVRWKMNI